MEMWFQRYECGQTDRHTDRETDMVYGSAQYSTPIGGAVTTQN